MRTAFALILIMILHCGLKSRAYWSAAGFEPGRTTFFWTESAMHEYVTERVARGETLDGLDRRAQHPEGLDLRRDFTLGMPWTLGSLYRAFSPAVPTDVFVAYALLFLSTFTVLGVFALARAVFASTGAALLSALAYAVSTAGIARSVGGYLHEDFAHPLVVGSLAIFLAGVERGRLRFAVAAAALAVAALASWHFSQFLLLAFAFGLVAAIVAGNRLPIRYVATFAFLVLAGTLAVPGLREQGVWASAALATLIGLVVFLASAGRFGRKRAFVFAALAVLAIAVVYAAFGFGQQSHVFGLMVEKLRHGFIKPVDPRKLGFEARSVWIEDDNSPDWFSLAFYTSFYLPLAAASAFHFRRGRRTTAYAVTSVMAASGLAMYVIARRMVTTDIIWLSTLAGGIVLAESRNVRIVVGMACLSLFGFETVKSWNVNRGGVIQRIADRAFGTETEPPLSTFGDQTDLLAWIRTQTGPDDAILAPIGLSPVILAQTNRPIVLHSKWESRALREKFERFLNALFANEDRFADFVRAVDARYFVHDVNAVARTGPDSARYVAGRENIDSDSAVYRFNYRPDQLTNFRLVYENSSYRVFEFVPGSPLAGTLPKDWVPPVLFDDALARSESRERIMVRLMDQRSRCRSVIELSQADPVRAEAILDGLVREGLRTWDVEAYLCYTRLALNDLDAAERHCRRGLAERPHSVVGRFHAGLLAEVRGDVAGARSWYRATLDADPRFAPALDRLSTDRR